MSDSNTIYHFGVLGMRWGVRRYQNKYGALTKAGSERKKKVEQEYAEIKNIKTLTAKGKQRKEQLAKHYKELTGKSINSVKSTVAKLDIIDDKELSRVKTMTSEELQTHNARQQLENTYLTNQRNSGAQTTKGTPATTSKSVHEMSNEELQAHNTRRQLENTYKSLQPVKESSKGVAAVKTVVNKAVVPAVMMASRKFIEKKATEFLDNIGVDNPKDTIKETKSEGDKLIKKAKSGASQVMKDINDINVASSKAKSKDIWSGVVEDTPSHYWESPVYQYLLEDKNKG